VQTKGKMKNSDQPISHITEAEKDRHDKSQSLIYLGLTKREYFAAMALQGYIAAGGNGMPSPQHLAVYATTTADALLNELDKNQPTQ
jgi:hypothetical protein